MNFKYDSRLLDYMEKHGKRTIAVEMVQINNSDFEVSELHVHFAGGRAREQLITKKRYRSVETGHGEVLLPPFPLEMADTVAFGLKTLLFFHHVTCEGIRI